MTSMLTILILEIVAKVPEAIDPIKNIILGIESRGFLLRRTIYLEFRKILEDNLQVADIVPRYLQDDLVDFLHSLGYPESQN